MLCVIVPTLNIAVRVEFMAHQVPSQAKKITYMTFAFRYAFVSLAAATYQYDSHTDSSQEYERPASIPDHACIQFSS